MCARRIFADFTPYGLNHRLHGIVFVLNLFAGEMIKGRRQIRRLSELSEAKSSRWTVDERHRQLDWKEIQEVQFFYDLIISCNRASTCNVLEKAPRRKAPRVMLNTSEASGIAFRT